MHNYNTEGLERHKARPCSTNLLSWRRLTSLSRPRKTRNQQKWKPKTPATLNQSNPVTCLHFQSPRGPSGRIRLAPGQEPCIFCISGCKMSLAPRWKNDFCSTQIHPLQRRIPRPKPKRFKRLGAPIATPEDTPECYHLAFPQCCLTVTFSSPDLKERCGGPGLSPFSPPLPSFYHSQGRHSIHPSIQHVRSGK